MPSIGKYDVTGQEWQKIGEGFYGIVKTVLVQPDGIYAGVWSYTHPVGTVSSVKGDCGCWRVCGASVSPTAWSGRPVVPTVFAEVLYVLGGLLLFAFLLLAAYFIVTRWKFPSHPLHESVARWCTSVVLLACVMTQGSMSTRVGITSQVSWVRAPVPHRD